MKVYYYYIIFMWVEMFDYCIGTIWLVFVFLFFLIPLLVGLGILNQFRGIGLKRGKNKNYL